ncbi:SET domain-containing protein [Streptomyces olivoreticuli]|uniref:SET domain-containing protein n=1 Tax=Streptomyces olivoreticuli TaxID=68246 RepID=UPI000E23C5D8|nr:SET domain-containing protein-lysine N-methyltransferase [Streptomyces olivoreticuli]
MYQPPAEACSHLAIRPTLDRGLGVFALRDFVAGDVVLAGRPLAELAERTDHSFQVGWETHVELDAPARLANHSCSPNTGVRNNAAGGYDFIALRDIAPGTEICWDYSSTEWESIAVPSCSCGSACCRGASRGFRHLTSEQVAGLHGFVADYLSPSVARAAVAENTPTS